MKNEGFITLLIIFLVCVSLFGAVQILLYFDVFAYGKGTSKLSDNIRVERKKTKKRRRAKWRLDVYTTLALSFSAVLLTSDVRADHTHFIERLGLANKALNRPYSVEELRGKYAVLLLGGILLCLLGLVHAFFLILGVLCIAVFFIYPSFYKQKIMDEDKIIDIYFIDLYLMLYARLRQGSKARLQTVIESYIDTLSGVSVNAEMQEVMLKFAKFFLNNLMQFEDHEAVPRLREKYGSPVIVNFCNIATQALQGVDNLDALLTLKMELVSKKTLVLQLKAEKLRARAAMAIRLIYVILGMFIVAGWVSKVPIGMLFG